MPFNFNFAVLVLTVVLLWSIKDSSSTNFHGFSKSCDDESPECFKAFVQSALMKFLNGIPELGIRSLDPFKFEKLQFALPSGLQIDFLNGQATGFKNCVIDSVRKNGTEYEIISHCNLTIGGQYKSSGRMIMFPVSGEGDCTIKCSKIKVQVRIQLIPKIADDGRDHLNIKKINSEHTFEEKVYYNFTNIFKGNPVLSNIVLNFMNDNWLMVAEEFGNPIVNYGITAMLNNVEELLGRVPSDELILK